MKEPLVGDRAHQDLVSVIRKVRQRWRTRLLLRGAIGVIVGAFVALTLASAGLQAYKFSPASVTVFRIVTLVVFAALVVWWLVRPLRRRVTDMQVALYVEEHETSLQAAILSAVDVGGTGAHMPPPVPPEILERMIAQAVDKVATLDGGRSVGRQAMRRHTAFLGAIVAAAALLLVVGPEFLRQGASALLILSRSAEAASPYAIRVLPGDATVPKGSDQAVSAKLAGFRSNNVTLRVKAEGDADYQSVPLVSAGDGFTYEGMLFSVKRPVQYYVDADGVRSPTYAMNVVELPAVENLELEYVYPSYTGLPPQKVPTGGDVAAIRGTEVHVRVKPTMSTNGGALDLEPGAAASLTPQSDGTLTGMFTIADDGFYHVELNGPHGEHVTASPKYTVDALEDQPPTVTFEKPKRDVKASPVEEVLLQARADDDFGVRSLQLIYSVNGGAEKTIDLYKQGAKALNSVSASHTVYLEEMNVKAGDFIQYYAQATDNDTVKGPKAVKSDVYFIEVRPFSQDFHQAQSQAGGGGGGGGGGNQNQPGALSEQERQIMSATFNVDRDKTRLAADKLKENTKFVGLSQAKLRGQVEDLVGQLQQRLGGGGTDNIKKIGELLPKAAAEMKKAEGSLSSEQTHDALSPEGKALQYLQQAEQLYEIEVQQNGGGGGGGGGGGSQQASELADMFQLQRDRTANQYETQQRASAQSASQQVDQLADKLRELARRQLEQAQQQQARGQQQQQAGGGGGGSSQRALADEVEQAARQLEQLQRDAERQGQPRQDLADAARRLQDSANAMRQAAASNADGGANASRALQQLQDAQRLLQQNQSASAGGTAKDALDKANQLVNQQKQIASGVQSASKEAPGLDHDSAIRQLGRDKDQLATGVTDLEQQLNTLGDQALANGQRDAARKLQQAAGTIRGQHVKDLIDFSKQIMGAGSDTTSNQVEGAIASNLDAVRQQVADAAAASDKADQGRGINRAAEQAADMVRGMSSLNDQLGQQLGQQGQGRQGQNGQQGMQGQQPGQQSGQGQQAQRGQQGAQGQGPQQGQQGAQGQQGQQGQQGAQGQGQGQQGAQGQQGQGQQGQGQGQGQQGDGRQGQGSGQPGGGAQRLGQAGNGSPNGNFNGRPGDANGNIRQLQNQANQMASDAEAMKRQLQQGGGTRQDMQSVDDFINALHQLGNDKGNADNIAGLSQAALDKIKKIEFELRKRTDTSNDELFVSGGDDAPAKYRALVDEYYRELSKKAGAAASQSLTK